MRTAGGRQAPPLHQGQGSGAPTNRSRSAASVPFEEIREAAKPFIEPLARRWLPNGARNGGWWVCCVPWREDKNPSFGWSLSTGRWRDFAGTERGDIFDLYVKLYGGGLSDAARQVARAIGHRFGEGA